VHVRKTKTTIATFLTLTLAVGVSQTAADARSTELWAESTLTVTLVGMPALFIFMQKSWFSLNMMVLHLLHGQSLQ